MKQAVFFERDGILNRAPIINRQQKSPLKLIEFEVNPEAIPVLAGLKQAGFMLIATTNQPGLSTGVLRRDELDGMHARLRSMLPYLDDILVCPHSEDDECSCRKPEIGLFLEAQFKWGLNLNRSYVVSDKWQDARAARTINATSVMLQSPLLLGSNDFTLSSLCEIGQKILKLQTGKPHAIAA